MKKQNNVPNKKDPLGLVDILNNKLVDILNMPVDKAVAELVKKGGKVINSIKQTTSDIFAGLSDASYEKMCRPVLTLDECTKWMRQQLKDYPLSAYLFVSYTKNDKPRNENDLLSVTLALLDSNKKPVRVIKNSKKSSVDTEQELVAISIPAKTLDSKLVKALNGEVAVMIKL